MLDNQTCPRSSREERLRPKPVAGLFTVAKNCYKKPKKLAVRIHIQPLLDMSVACDFLGNF